MKISGGSISGAFYRDVRAARATARKCRRCGGPRRPGDCTNGACWPCHQTHCTEGGNTSPGHNPRVCGGRLEQCGTVPGHAVVTTTRAARERR